MRRRGTRGTLESYPRPAATEAVRSMQNIVSQQTPEAAYAKHPVALLPSTNLSRELITSSCSRSRLRWEFCTLPVFLAAFAILSLGAVAGFGLAIRGIGVNHATAYDNAMGTVLRALDMYVTVTVINPATQEAPVPNLMRYTFPDQVALLNDEKKQTAQEQIVSCEENQELFQIENDFLSAKKFAEMQACLVNHPKITDTTLNQAGFNGTRGFVTRFGSEQGVEKFSRDSQLNCFDNSFNPLLTFFEAARDPLANAFVMNVLVCDKPSNAGALVVGTHVDDTLGHTIPNTQFLAHQVNVLYINVPSDMVGGELEILGPSKQIDVNNPQASISPVENVMASFRGDSYHQVRGYHTETDKLRISLVLEQYRVPEQYMDGLIEYEEEMKGGMMMF